MNENYTVKNATFFVLNDGIYEKECVFNGIQEIHVEDELSHRPDLICKPQSFAFTGECEFRASLRFLIRLLGFYHGIKMWFEMEFKRK